MCVCLYLYIYNSVCFYVLHLSSAYIHRDRSLPVQPILTTLPYLNPSVD